MEGSSEDDASIPDVIFLGISKWTVWYTSLYDYIYTISRQGREIHAQAYVYSPTASKGVEGWSN